MEHRASAVLVLALALAPASGAVDRTPPVPGCLDARAVQEVVQSDDYTLAVRTADESRYRLDLALRCPAIASESDVKLVSPGGWVCGRGKDVVATATRGCAVAHVARIDAKGFSTLALQAGRAPAPDVLDRVTVKGQKRHGFAGSPAYCFNTNHMRSWSEDPDGIVVEVSPLRSGGHRFYRVELGASCQGLTDGSHLSFRSGVGGAMVCGFAGDRAIFRTHLESQDGLIGSMVAGAFEGPIGERSRVGRGGQVAGVTLPTAGCPVVQVYPLDPQGKRPLAQVSPAR